MMDAQTVDSKSVTAYKVAEIAAYGYELDGAFYSFDMQKARDNFAHRIWRHRKAGNLSRDNDERKIKRGEHAFDGSIMSVTPWISTRYETECGTEYDEEPQEICLWQIEVIE